MKKETKKDIFARYGIEYENGRINYPVFGWRPALLINGNDKLGKGVYTFSILPTDRLYSLEYGGETLTEKGTCGGTCTDPVTGKCTCYACAGHCSRFSVRLSWLIKTFLCRNYPEFVENAINAQIEAEKIKVCRIHAAGDFFILDYLNMWARIIAKNSSCVFWTYTKKTEYEHAFDAFPNANIVKSIIPGYGFNYGPCDYILRVYKALTALDKKVFVCRCGIDKNQHCSSCGSCQKNDYVLFIEHSTDYKAEKDPAYDELRALIESQKIETLEKAA